MYSPKALFSVYPKRECPKTTAIIAKPLRASNHTNRLLACLLASLLACLLACLLAKRACPHLIHLSNPFVKLFCFFYHFLLLKPMLISSAQELSFEECSPFVPPVNRLHMYMLDFLYLQPLLFRLFIEPDIKQNLSNSSGISRLES